MLYEQKTKREAAIVRNNEIMNKTGMRELKILKNLNDGDPKDCFSISFCNECHGYSDLIFQNWYSVFSKSQIETRMLVLATAAPNLV